MNEIAHLVNCILSGQNISTVNMADWPAPWPRLAQIAAECEGNPFEFQRLVEIEFNGSGGEYVKQVLADEEKPIAGPGETEKVFRTFDVFDFVKRPDKEWLIDKFLGRNDFGMLFGPPGKGKTFVTLDMIFALITGQQFAGKFDIAKPVKVLYCTDEGVDGLKQRLLSLLQRYNPAPGLFRVCIDMPQLFLDCETSWKKFIEEQADFDPDLVVLDTLFNAMVGARENVADDASVAIHNAKAVKTALGCSLLLDHHSNKAGEWPRGTSAWIGSMDLIAQIDNGTMACFKAKDGPQFEALGFELEAVGESVIPKWTGVSKSLTGPGALGEIAFEFLRANQGQHFTARELAQIFEVHQTSLKRELDKYVGRGLIKAAPRNPNLQPSSVNPTLYTVLDPHAGVTFSNLSPAGEK